MQAYNLFSPYVINETEGISGCVNTVESKLSLKPFTQTYC